MTQTQIEAYARLSAAEAEFLQAHDWRPLAPLTPGGPVGWIAPDSGLLPNRYGQEEAVKLQKNWNKLDRASQSQPTG